MTPEARTNLILLIEEYARTEYALGAGGDDRDVLSKARHVALGNVLDAVFAIDTVAEASICDLEANALRRAADALSDPDPSEWLRDRADDIARSNNQSG